MSVTAEDALDFSRCSEEEQTEVTFLPVIGWIHKTFPDLIPLAKVQQKTCGSFC